jgi:hypothetical protein
MFAAILVLFTIPTVVDAPGANKFVFASYTTAHKVLF